MHLFKLQKSSWEIWTHKAPCSSLKILLRESKPNKNLGAEAVHLQYTHASTESSKNLIHIRYGHDHVYFQLFNIELIKKVRFLEHIRAIAGQRGNIHHGWSAIEKFIKWKKNYQIWKSCMSLHDLGVLHHVHVGLLV